MPPFARTGAGERRAGSGARGVQAGDQIVRQERTVTRHAGDPFALRQMQRRPIEAGENAGERTSKIGHAVSDYRQLGIGKARRVAVGVDQEIGALRLKASEHAFKDGDPANRDSRLVAAAHATRQTAGEDEAESRRVHWQGPSNLSFRAATK